ncbi:MAG: hypothetical protein JXB32_12550, partial [Deltaproteobacteria bacterium]|nr:hypothetical protein [Deltaproteobacteria bacterium]
MRLFARQVDRDFPGGLYLDPLGPIPPVDHIETVAPADELRIPLLHPDVAPLVRPGDAVIPGQPIAAGRGYALHAPAAATVGPTTTVWCRDRGSQSALTLHVSAGQPLAEPLRLPDADLPPLDNPEHARRRIAHALQHAGIVTSAGRPLAADLERLARRCPCVVIANAVPLEPNLNASLALLHCFGPEVFAGLAILKTVLHA